MVAAADAAAHDVRLFMYGRELLYLVVYKSFNLFKFNISISWTYFKNKNWKFIAFKQTLVTQVLQHHRWNFGDISLMNFWFSIKYSMYIYLPLPICLITSLICINI